MTRERLTFVIAAYNEALALPPHPVCGRRQPRRHLAGDRRPGRGRCAGLGAEALAQLRQGGRADGRPGPGARGGGDDPRCGRPGPTGAGAAVRRALARGARQRLWHAHGPRWRGLGQARHGGEVLPGDGAPVTHADPRRRR
ncbi:hypothetical protein G6F46_014181 [Rhizopus delemar]|nr:hypothetical protein G6F46_014181 [Rhizopus delemar]